QLRQHQRVGDPGAIDYLRGQARVSQRSTDVDGCRVGGRRLPGKGDLSHVVNRVVQEPGEEGLGMVELNLVAKELGFTTLEIESGGLPQLRRGRWQVRCPVGWGCGSRIITFRLRELSKLAVEVVQRPVVLAG